VYVGREGWLFYRPDVEHVTGRGFLEPAQLERRIASAREIDVPPQPDPRAAIAQFKRDLDARGIVLIVMPIPVKPTVHPCALARPCEAARSGPPASSVPSAALHDAASSAPSAALQPAATSAAQFENASQSELIADLRRDGVLVFDPVPVLLRSDSGEPQYLRTDTHWRPEAMQRVAEALAAFIQAQVALPFVTEPGYRAEPREARQIGDTAAMLDLPAGQALYPPERVALRFVLGPDGDPWRPSRDADVLVLGDSFTNMYSLATMGWGEAAGLVEQLSHVLRRPVDRIVQNDQGASATRELLRRELGDEGDRLAGKRVVVWQFAARELSFGDWRVIELPPSQ
jgi:alginate O-acetyltransferase complex protein AlgJ